MAPAAPGPAGLERTIAELKHPVEWLAWGADFRVRNEYFTDLLTLNQHAPLHEQDYFRYRARLWAGVTPVPDVTLNTRLATEPRTWLEPAGYSPFKGRSGTDATEGIFDLLNVEWKNLLGQPLSVVVGRQDILLGDGWLTGEGTPYDGSWTFSLDAARLAYEWKERRTVFEVIGILQEAKDDAWLPTLNNQNRYQSEQNEKGVICSVVNSSLPAANFNPYFIYKHDDKLNDPQAPPCGDNADIYTLGGRVFGAPADHWKYSLEGAYQFGEKEDPAIKFPAGASGYRNLSAFGLTSRLTCLVKDRWNTQLSLAYEYLSGDDPATGSDEMFDVLWGRWPHWGEIGLYSYAPETRVGQQASLHRIGPSWSVTPARGLDFTAAYYALFADQATPTRGAGVASPTPVLFSRSGTFRGHFVSGVLKYKFNPHVLGHLWAEAQFPGDYYVHQGLMTFLRAEVMLVF